MSSALPVIPATAPIAETAAQPLIAELAAISEKAAKHRDKLRCFDMALYTGTLRQYEDRGTLGDVSRRVTSS
jgi:hypothetical protein